MGLVERSGKRGGSCVRPFIVPNISQQRLQAEIVKNIAAGSHLMTDALPSYQQLAPKAGIVHHFVDHACQYVKQA